MQLQEKIRGQKISGPAALRHLQPDGSPECAVPEFGGHDLLPPQNPELWRPPTLIRGGGA
jgi:NADH-quinone oxidoreductase subunit B